MQETQVQSLGREGPLEEEMATHSSILAWETPEQRSLEGYSPWGHRESDITERLITQSMRENRNSRLILQGPFVMLDKQL